MGQKHLVYTKVYGGLTLNPQIKPMYNPFLLGADGTPDLLLVYKVWQERWDSHFLDYVML